MLVRHGETEGESSIRLNGVTDVPLSEHGREQIRRAARALADERFDRAYVSSLCRSMQSHALLSSLEPIVVHDFREIDFGEWEAMTWAEVEARDPVRYAQARSATRRFQYPAGDSREGFYERVADAARRHLAAPNGRVLAALHKGVTKIAIATLCELDWDQYRTLPCELGSIHRLRWNGGRWEYVVRNRTDHLGNAWLEDHPPRAS